MQFCYYKELDKVGPSRIAKWRETVLEDVIHLYSLKVLEGVLRVMGCSKTP